MSVRVDTTLAKLGADLNRIPDDWLPQVGKHVVQGAVEEFHDSIVRRSPVGTLRTKNHRGTSVHPGKYRASHLVSSRRKRFARLSDKARNPVPGVTDAIRGLSGFAVGDSVFVTNDAKSDGARESYAAVLEAGWSTSQAPDGVYEPSLQDLEARSNDIIRKGIQKALREAI